MTSLLCLLAGMASLWLGLALGDVHPLMAGVGFGLAVWWFASLIFAIPADWRGR